MVGADDESRFVGFGGSAQPEPREGAPAAPLSTRDQSCAVRGSSAVAWVHPLDSAKVAYRAYGKEWTLPGFWTVCDVCEQVYATGDDEATVARMKLSDGWLWDTADDEHELLRMPLAAFRAADLGGRRLAD